MFRNALIFALLFVSSAALAAPTVTSITPSSGSVVGGTTVTIRGSGFSESCPICSPPFYQMIVMFGGTPAASVRVVNETTIEAVTPPVLPLTVSVSVTQWDGTTVLGNAFTFTGDPSDGFEPLLLPIFGPPVRGAFGSEFHTVGRAFNNDSGKVVNIYGMDTNCYLFQPVIDPTTGPFAIEPRGERTLLPDCSYKTGRLLWVPKGTADSLALNVRVTDVSRASLTHGTEIPVVRRSDFKYTPITLLGVPQQPHYRSTLRIYSLERGPSTVLVTFNGQEREVTLTPGENIFEPAAAVFSDFPDPATLPPDQQPMRVTIRRPEPTIIILAPAPPPIWAFITVTNNETQQITTITPN